MRSDSIIIALASVACIISAGCKHEEPKNEVLRETDTALFVPPDTSTIPDNATGDMIRYGRDLLVNFPYYLGPKGSVGSFGGNGLGCQNCHLEAGTRPFGLNYFSAHARYPQYRAREGRILTLGDRINNCIERPLNGRSMPLDSKEMVAMLAYMQWLGKGVPVGERVHGDNLKAIALLDRPADPVKGRAVYDMHCMRCHGDDGQGVQKEDGIAYVYPPLWGPMSYQPGSSMHRLIKSAQFIKYNMPNDIARWDAPVLTDEEAMDVAAYVNDDRLHTRPQPDPTSEYPIHKEKPLDYFLPPYADPFSADQHKYGPFKPIVAWRSKNGQPTGY
jgi:thiosulfate dehydrogenase